MVSNIYLGHIWFPDYGPTLLREKVISRYGDFDWPPKSCDLEPLDCFLRGYTKCQIYKTALSHFLS